MKKAAFALIIITLFFACNRLTQQAETQQQEERQAVYRKITAEEAYRQMSELNDYILLDVRTEDEFAATRIDGAILIPDYEIDTRAETELHDKNKPIFVYCGAGVRSKKAARILVALGYTNVFDFGGIKDWPYETWCKCDGQSAVR